MMSNELKMHYASLGLYERIVHGLKAIGCRVRAAKTAEKAVGGKVDALYFAFEGMPH